MGGGKGGGGGGSQTSYSTSLPPFAEKPYLRNIERAEGAVEEPYQLYPDQRISQFTPDTLAAQQGIRGLAQYGTPGADRGLQFTDFGTQQAFSAGQYLPTDINAAPTGSTSFAEQSVAPGSQVGTGVFDQAAADQYMSPFIDTAIARQLDRANLDYNRQRQVREGEYAQADAFGGSRSAVDEAINRDIHDRQLQDITARGYEQAFGQAQQQFERDQGRALQSGIFNVQAGLQGDLANQQANLQAQQFGEQSRQFGFDARLQQQSQNEQLRQAALGLGLQGTDLGMRGAGQLTSIDAAKQTQQLDQLRNLAAVGQDVQNLDQRSLDLAYQDFINQRDYPRQNAAYMSGILQGVPVSPQQEILYQQQVNPANQLLGLGLGGLGLYNSFQQ